MHQVHRLKATGRWEEIYFFDLVVFFLEDFFLLVAFFAMALLPPFYV